MFLLTELNQCLTADCEVEHRLILFWEHHVRKQTPEEMKKKNPQKITLHQKEYDSHVGRLGRLQRSLVHLSVIAVTEVT